MNREFWIDKEYAEDHYDGQNILELKPDADKIDNFIHVVEASALESAKRELEVANKKLKAIEDWMNDYQKPWPKSMSILKDIIA